MTGIDRRAFEPDILQIDPADEVPRKVPDHRDTAVSM
jgi:hypothetical protein